MNKRLAFKLVLCQIASDAGKDIYDPDLIRAVGRPAAKRAIRQRYVYKDQLIKELCFDIAHNRKSGFRFWWQKPDYDETWMAIVYFECKLGDEVLQVSFHNPSDAYKKWEPGSKDFKSNWDEKSSRAACLQILKAIKKA